MEMDKEAGPRVVEEEIFRLKRDEIEDDQSKDVYLKDLVALYPFLFVDFEIKESVINDATTGEHVVTDEPDKHLYARPRECQGCNNY